ncbi:MAG TPA: NFACT RNA binding domain-containing protein [Candidatus Norongarragalinales archaeon]|jgi:predicted ribosome quality control (RQC) complex YloA/Tae2 family protein|nr:NFACT RNA binding domain-containing protein [Candidatus Norongarragalinales archaeon]
MKIKLDYRKHLHDNAQVYYEEAKKFKAKSEGVKKAIKDTERKIEEATKHAAREELSKPTIRIKEARKKEWFEKFRWFFTSTGKLVIAGRDAKQNELAVSKYFEEGDLFFHADVIGAPATILKGGLEASEQEKKEAAMFAGSYSSAWRVGHGAADVYAVKKEQVSKSPESGEYLAKGGFIIRGQREWFRGTTLKIVIGKEENRLVSLPFNHAKLPKERVVLTPGEAGRGDVAKAIKARLRLDSADEAAPLVPGDSRVQD